MENAKKIICAGGVGDACLIMSKLTKKFNTGEIDLIWTERYEEHKKPIEDITSYYNCRCEIVKDSRQKTKEEQEKGRIYIDSVMVNESDPYYNFPNVKEIKLTSSHSIVIVANAGRLKDSTRRIVTDKFIMGAVNYFSNSDIILLGNEKREIAHGRIINMTQKTPSILDAIGIVKSSNIVIGHDGVLVYSAALMKKKTLINYHIDTLLSHYWNNKWGKHCIGITGHGNSLDIMPVPQNDLKKWINE